MKKLAIGALFTILILTAVTYVLVKKDGKEVSEDNKAVADKEIVAIHQQQLDSLVKSDKEEVEVKYEGVHEQLQQDDEGKSGNDVKGNSGKSEPKPEPKPETKPEPTVESKPVVSSDEPPKQVNRELTVTMTYYTAGCKGCSGITKAGYDIRNTVYYDGMRVVAVDPNVIPMYSIVEYEHQGKMVRAIALDTGGAIKGNRIDMLVENRPLAYELGRQTKKVTVIREGK